MDIVNSIKAELSNQKNRDILLEKVALLKTYVSLLEGTIEAPISRRSLAEIQSNLLCNSGVTTHISDVQSYRNWNTEFYCNIFPATEMPCIKLEQNSKFIFEISNIKDIAKKNLYIIEILIDDKGHGKLGKCTLPNFIDVRKVLSQHPINNLNNVKHFLKSCKHHIDCYISRQKQIDELKKLFLEAENADISYNDNISLIELTMIGIKDMDTTKLYDVALYLHYNVDETRPYKLSSTADDFEVPTSILIRKFNKYFEPFLRMDLTSALLQISEFRNEFVWEILMEDDKDDVEIYEDETDEENTGLVTQYLHRGAKVMSDENERQNNSTGNESKQRMKTKWNFV